MLRHVSILLLALGAAACTGQSEQRKQDSSAAPATTAATPDAAAESGTRSGDAAIPDAASASTESKARQNPANPNSAQPDPAQHVIPASQTIGFAGFGPAKFGATQEEVRMAWGKDMSGKPDEPGGCYYLQPMPEGGPVAFMLEGDRFVRVDVRGAALTAPGGGQAGMTIAEIRKRYPGVEVMPHKYEENAKYLRVKDPAGGTGVRVFETDAAGTVTRWRIGTAPQVDYVEGCA